MDKSSSPIYLKEQELTIEGYVKEGSNESIVRAFGIWLASAAAGLPPTELQAHTGSKTCSLLPDIVVDDSCVAHILYYARIRFIQFAHRDDVTVMFVWSCGYTSHRSFR